jgi:hypothetical protein
MGDSKEAAEEVMLLPGEHGMGREAAGSRDMEPPAGQPASHAVNEHEMVPPQHDVLAQPAAGEAAEASEEGRTASTLEMWFREAEVIARNLKESGTRR